MPTQKQIHDYIVGGALNYPLKDKAHLISMVCLHFDIDYINAGIMVNKEIQQLRYNPFES